MYYNQFGTGYGYGTDYGYAAGAGYGAGYATPYPTVGYPRRTGIQSFSIVLVLFILLVIIGCVKL